MERQDAARVAVIMVSKSDWATMRRRLRLYGKRRPAVGRKMGHVLIFDEDGQDGQDGAEVAEPIATNLARAVAAGPGERAWT